METRKAHISPWNYIRTIVFHFNPCIIFNIFKVIFLMVVMEIKITILIYSNVVWINTYLISIVYKTANIQLAPFHSSFFVLLLCRLYLVFLSTKRFLIFKVINFLLNVIGEKKNYNRKNICVVFYMYLCFTFTGTIYFFIYIFCKMFFMPGDIK